ncbi:MAG: 30S ribosomal protein S6 [Candidatus Woesearchaeota archaeon]
MKKYEMMIVVSGQLPEDLAKEITNKVKKTIEESNGLEITEDFWGRRKLSYKIQNQDHGYYAVFNFSLEPKKISELELEVKMISEIIRFIIVSDDSKNSSVKSEKIIKEKEKKVEKVEKEDIVEKVSKEKEKKVEKVEKEDIVEKVYEEKNDDNRLEELDKKIDEILND